MKVLAISNWNMFSILIINLFTYICIQLAYIYTINNVCDTWVENIFNSNLTQLKLQNKFITQLNLQNKFITQPSSSTYKKKKKKTNSRHFVGLGLLSWQVESTTSKPGCCDQWVRSAKPFIVDFGPNHNSVEVRGNKVLNTIPISYSNALLVQVTSYFVLITLNSSLNYCSS